MANIVQNKLTVLGPQSDVELLRIEIAEKGVATGSYHDLGCLLFGIRDLRDAGQEIVFETYWKPPYTLLSHISKSYPRLVLCLSFLGEDYWYGRLIYCRGYDLSCEEYRGMERKDHAKAQRMFKSHHIIEGRGRKLFSHLESLRPEWLEGE